MRSKPRPRHECSATVLALLSPFFRRSLVRDAYVLRGIGSKHGPVLKARPTGRFDRQGDRESV
jgi:hypothetical protein